MSKYINPYTDFGFKKLFGEEAFHEAELANMTSEQYEQYQESLMTYVEVKEVIKTAENDGIEIGERKKAIEIAKELKRLGVEMIIIIQSTGLSQSEIEQL